jgi:hypothetical protein
MTTGNRAVRESQGKLLAGYLTNTVHSVQLLMLFLNRDTNRSLGGEGTTEVTSAPPPPAVTASSRYQATGAIKNYAQNSPGVSPKFI